MIKRFYILLLAIVASVGMMNAKVTWNSSNISDFYVYGTYQSYSKEGVTLSANADQIEAMWFDYGDESYGGIMFNAHETGGFTFSNTLGKNFTKIEMTLRGPADWDMANLGSGWSFFWEPGEESPVFTVTWTGNASTVDLLKEASNFSGDYVKSIVFYFVGDSEEPDPTYTVALKDGTANADKVTLSATSVVEGATVTVTLDEEYEFTAFKATYNTTEELSTSFNTETDAYSFKMPAANVTIEATIALKPVPEGDIFAGFTATAGSGGFDNEGHANLVDNKFTSADWTKWCADNSYKSVPTGESGDACWWIDFEASAALNLTGYILTTGNDTGNEHGRNPKNWVLKAKLNADDAWTTIATVTNDVTMKNKSFKDYKFFVDQSGSYKYFRFEVFANQGAGVMQLCQLRLIGTEASAPANSCGGGLTWELNNGELVISYNGTGTGVMNDFDIPNDNPAPWYANREDITSVSLPEGIKTIGKDAFRDCVNLTTVTIPNSVTTIGESAFVTVEHLETVTIGTGITSIVNGAFYGNDELTTVTCSATTPPSIGAMVFESCTNLTQIFVPAASVDAYKTAWSDYASLIKAIGGGSAATVVTITEADFPTGGNSLTKDGVTVSAGWIEGNSYDIYGEGSFSTTLGNFTKIEVCAAEVSPLGEGWSGNSECQTWTGNASSVSFSDNIMGNSQGVTLKFTIGDAAAAPAYETVMNLIDAIGTVELTAECKAKIDAARAAFIALSDGDKAQVTNYETLTTAEAAFDNVMDIWLSGDCDVILWKDTTLTVRKHAGEGNGAMADYTDYYGDNTAPWFNSHWYNPQPGDIVIKSVTLEEGVTHIGENAFGWMSELKTITIPSSMTSIGEDAFYWSKAVDDIYLSADPSNLTWVLPYSADNQFKAEKATRCHVPADLLTAYLENFGTLNMTFVGDLDPITPLTPEQQQALDAAKGLINAIPSPVVYTPACKEAIDAARAAYDALTPDMLKQLVSNYATLTAAEATYESLKDVAVAEAKIAAIPQPVKLKLATRDSIESARAAYDALTADQKLLVSNYDVLTAAEAELATLNPGGGMPAGALNGKFSINADGDQIAFAKGNLQATTTDLGANWTWGFAANQWDYLGIAVANNAISGNGTVSENGTVDLFGWSTAATYYGINNSFKAVDYPGDFVDWGPNMGAGWRTLTKDEWAYLLQHSSNGKAAVNDKNGYIFLPDNWSGPAFTPNPDNFTTNVYSGDDWTAMENAGAVFLPYGPARNGKSALIAMDAKYSSSTSLNNDTSYVFTIYYNQSQSACTGTNRAYGCMVRLVSEGGGATPLDSAQAVKDLIDAIPAEITLDAACVNAVQAARDAYNALSEAAQGALDAATVNKLNQAITDYTALIQAGADEVIAKINAIPQPVTLKLATRDSIESARAAYEALTADQKALVPAAEYQKLTDAEAALAAYISIPDGALNGKFTINAAGDVISFAKGNLQATTADLGEHWTWGVAANQWEVIGAEVANTAIIGSGKVSANGTVDMFGWSTPATYFGIYHTMDGKDYLGDFVDWGTNLGAGWRTLAIDEWGYLLKTRENAANLRGQATVNGVHGMILLPNDWTTPTGLTFTAMPNNWTTNVYADADWTAMEEAGAVFLPVEGVRWEQSLYSTDGGCYWSSTPAEDAQSAEYVLLNEETPILGGVEWLMDYGGRDNGISVRLAAFSVNPFDDAQAVKDMIDALPNSIDYFSKDAIKAARAAYDALANETKAALDKATIQHLIDAENRWNAIAAKIEQNVYYIGKDGELKNEKVALFNIPDPAPDFNGYEFVRWDVKAGNFLEEGLRIKAVYTPIITTNPVAYDTLVFNRADQELVVAGIAKEGHIEYRIGEGEWSAELPKAMNAGTYEVTYKLVREGHDDYFSPNQISVTIAKTQVAFDAPVAYDTLTYNYNSQTLIAAGQTLDGTFEYTLDPTDAQSWNTELPQGMHAGTYNVNFRVIGDMNHFDSIVESPIVVTIAKRDIVVTAPAAYDTLVYNAQAQTLAIDGTTDFNTMEYTLTPNDDNSWFTTMPKALNAGSYDIYYRVPGDANHNDFEPQNITATIAQAPLTITAIDSTIVYGDEAPEFFASYSGWQGEDNESVVSGLAYTCTYEQGSYVGTYAITPNSATSLNYAMTFVEGTLTVIKAAVYVSGAEVHIAKFEDNTTDAEVTAKGVLNGVKLNDPVDHITTASFSSADVAEHLTITLFYELTGDAALLNNYYLTVTSEVYTEEGVIIEQMLPDNDHQPGEGEQVEVKEGIDVYVFGYCDGSGYSLKYHLNRGIPDQYMIDFEDSRFTDVDWTNLETPGKDGTIFVEIPVDLPTGDYSMTVQFRDSRFVWLESQQFNVTFHVNLPETYTMPLFDNVIALVDTCNCFTDIQWYYRANSTDTWEPIPGATGYYYHTDGKLTGEYFVKAKKDGVETYTCPQTDMETLYKDNIRHTKVRAYPNPVIDKTTVVIEDSYVWQHNLRIVNLMGVEMENTTFEGFETTVEMSNYPQGHYMISVDGIVVKVMKK